MARPTKLSDEVTRRLVAALRVGATHEHAALVAGISARTFYGWMQRGESATRGQFVQFVQAVKRAEAEAAVKGLARLEQAADEGVWQAGAWKRERRSPGSAERRRPRRC